MVAERVHGKDELAELVTVAGADDKEVDGVRGIEGLDGPGRGPLPDGDELADLGGGRPGRAEPEGEAVKGELVRCVSGTLGFGHRPRAGEPAGVVDERLRRKEIRVGRGGVRPRPEIG
ncbi:hypothetical protein GCM10010449_26250 [Streptomyces rectiviolaceus]|uniref:Uncharacterized protein n=1 Tax=Streptomyces rectiviolaceus TaxID=332591 RepID=A0ABP6MER5_9ACTN